ncbi:MAG: tail fiber protein [Prevotella sp.]|jgi:microcystin-dependent protein|nr:tail fiber protein [Prevotella sp.]
MNRGNFTAKDNFPVSTFTYDFLQKMAQLAGSMAQLGGQKYILSGCTLSGTTVSAGLIVINGEILPFESGTMKAKITIQETKDTEHYEGVDYPESYVHRVAKFADNGEYNWADFVQVLTNKELEEKIGAIRSESPGFVKMWSGAINRLDESKYLLCDGRTVNTIDYPDLAYFYGKEGESSFKLPDLRQRFIVGYDNGIADYDSIGKTGGEKEHTLSVNEVPSHKHIYPWGENVNQEWNPPWDYADEYLTGRRGSDGNDSDNAWAYTSPVGGGEAHENRPPFYVLAFVVRVNY